MIIDNFDKIRSVMRFDKNDRHDNFYKFTLLIRDKDGENPFLNRQRKEYIVKEWFIESVEQFDRHIEEFKYITDLIHGRLYMTCEMKSVEKCLKTLVEDTLNRLYEHIKNPMQGTARMLPKLIASVSQKTASSARHGKLVMFDVDTKDWEVVEELKSELGSFYLDALPTKNGYHVLAERKFDTKKFELPRDTTLCTGSFCLAYLNLKD